MTIKEKVVAYKAALQYAGASEFRLSLPTDEAIKLAAELQPAELNHAEKVTGAVASWNKLLETPLPSDFDERHAHVAAQGTARDDFWDGFNGQEVAGVEIHRRR